MYYFFDYDETTKNDQTIDGCAYLSLLNVCFKYSVSFSMVFHSENIERKISRFLSPFYREFINLGSYNSVVRCYYYCTPESYDFLSMYVNDLFEWIMHSGYNNPEDLTFYRKNGSIFFWSETHEGVCAIFDDSQEDVSLAVSSDIGWVKYDNSQGFIYGIPKDLYMSEST